MTSIVIFPVLAAIALYAGVIPTNATAHHHTFVVGESIYNRLCSNKSILTINGQFPGPTVYVTEGDTVVIDVINRATQNITIHWHGVKQPRNPWSDGPAYITQCPIRPGTRFKQTIFFSDEIGTLWWHAHSDWSRATVHGLLVIYPRRKTDYPFPVPDIEIPIILGEWWKSDIQAVVSEFQQNGGDPNVSDAFLINGQPGDLYPCSTSDTFKLTVDYGKRYLLRMVNAAMNNIMFFRIASHNLTVVGSDGAYTKPLTSNYIVISPGQTMDVLLQANQPPSRYYMAARVFATAATYDNTTTTAIIQYRGRNLKRPSTLSLPSFPKFNDAMASANFTRRLRSLADAMHPIDVPLKITTRMFITLSINTSPCGGNQGCSGPFGERLLASMNNITFRSPKISILEAYYNQRRGVYRNDYPNNPPLTFNFTADIVPRRLWRPENGTSVRILEYNSTVEIVFQGTNTVAGIDHPMHLHGHSFYVVGWGFGNFNKDRDPAKYNLVDPPLQNTIAVPRNGWTTIRFIADNPGVWLMHCHLERHVSWGMEMVFITKNGRSANGRMHPPPQDFPTC